MEKYFIWKDKSGRGYVNNSMELSTILENENEENWDGDDLHEWAENAEVGDEWENATDYYMCIQIN